MIGEALDEEVGHSSDDDGMMIREDSLPLGSGPGGQDDEAIRKYAFSLLKHLTFVSICIC